MDIEQLFLLFIIYSFLGWIVEIIDIYVLYGKIINRGFLIGPYCPIYGVGALIITFVLTDYKDDLLVLCVMSMFFCAVLEYFTSYVMEKIFKTRWWDYSDRRFNLNGRISLFETIGFGILGIVVVYVLNPLFINLLTSIPQMVTTTIAFVILFLFLLDVAVSFKIITSIKTINFGTVKDSTEEITKIVRNTLANNSILKRRLVKAFPNLKMSNIWFTKSLKKMKQKLESLNKKGSNSPQ